MIYIQIPALIFIYQLTNVDIRNYIILYHIQNNHYKLIKSNIKAMMSIYLTLL